MTSAYLTGAGEAHGGPAKVHSVTVVVDGTGPADVYLRDGGAASTIRWRGGKAAANDGDGFPLHGLHFGKSVHVTGSGFAAVTVEYEPIGS